LDPQIKDPSKYLTNHTAVYMEGEEQGGRNRVAVQCSTLELATSDKEIPVREERERVPIQRWT
jgi:hypothetical protein